MNSSQLSELIQTLNRKVDELIGVTSCLPSRFLTIKNAAKYSDLSEESIRRLISKHKLTAHRPVRGRVLIDRQELDAFIRSCVSTPRNSRGASRTK